MVSATLCTLQLCHYSIQSYQAWRLFSEQSKVCLQCRDVFTMFSSATLYLMAAVDSASHSLESSFLTLLNTHASTRSEHHVHCNSCYYCYCCYHSSTATAAITYQLLLLLLINCYYCYHLSTAALTHQSSINSEDDPKQCIKSCKGRFACTSDPCYKSQCPAHSNCRIVTAAGVKLTDADVYGLAYGYSSYECVCAEGYNMTDGVCVQHIEVRTHHFVSFIQYNCAHSVVKVSI
jgi:hypothetical protein